MVGMALLIQQCNSRQRTAVVLQHAQQIIVHDNCTATIKDTAGMNGWHGSAHSVITHVQQRTLLLLLQHAADCYT
jgi:hypothetical protein